MKVYKEGKFIRITEKIHMIADHYGYCNQSRQCIEEMAELTQAICKWDREWGDLLFLDSHECKERTQIIEEIADCKIMLEQLEYLLSAEYEVDLEIERKIDRQLDRIRESES